MDTGGKQPAAFSGRFLILLLRLRHKSTKGMGGEVVGKAGCGKGQEDGDGVARIVPMCYCGFRTSSSLDYYLF